MSYNNRKRRPMHRSNIIVVGMLLLLVVPAISLQGIAQEDDIPFWNPTWSYREEIQLPIITNDSATQYQPIDLRITFERPCWTENENNTSIRICCWQNQKWDELESQIYSLKKSTGSAPFITECNVIFLIPPYADGTERYFLYYNGGETPKPAYKDHVDMEDANYSSSPLPELSGQARFYGIIEDGYSVYAVGQEGKLLDRPCAQVVVKQKKDAKEFDILGSDQIVSFAFSYYYGSKEKDESSSDQVFIDKKIIVDGNLMVEFGIISESEKKDVRTTAIYKYYYNPLDDKRINVHVKHEMLKDAIVQGIVNVDGRYGSLISIKSRSATVDALNFGQIYPYLDFYSEDNKIVQYQLNQNPATKNREWIISFKDGATLGKEAWLSYGEGREGIASAVLFASNQGLVLSGTDERDGIQLKVAEKEYVNFLGTEIDYVSINFGRHSYEPGSSHDITIPSNLIVQFDAEVFRSDSGGYDTVQKESHIYQTLMKSRQLSGEIPFEGEQKRYNVTIIPRFGGALLSHPWLSNRTGGAFPVMWIELNREGRLVAEGAANRSLFLRAKITFNDILEGDYLVKIYLKWGNATKRFTGSTILHLLENTKVNVFCTWERTITFSFVDQYGQGITGVHGWLINKDGILYDENITQSNGKLIVKAPFNAKDSYTLRAEYKNFIVYDSQLPGTLKKVQNQVSIALYTFTAVVTDSLGLPPGVDLAPLLVTSSNNRTIQLTAATSDNGSFTFEGVPEGDYTLQISYGDFLDNTPIAIPTPTMTIPIKFSALYELTIDLYDIKGNALTDDTVELTILRDNQSLMVTKEKTFSLPPAQYTIKAFKEGELIGIKQVGLTNDQQLIFVTTVDSLFPLVLTLFFSFLFGFFTVLTALKKFSVSSLLKCLAILFVILSFFQPWWLFDATSATPPAEKSTALYVNPGAMIETIKYYGEISLSIAETPDVFNMLLAAIVPLALLACISLVLGILSKRMKKKNYALLLSIGGVLLLSIILSSFYYGTTKLAETSIGVVQGEKDLVISIGSEEILMHSMWGFNLGFYFVCIAVIVATISLLLDIRMRIMRRKQSLSPQN
jgi:hypothetical protein